MQIEHPKLKKIVGVKILPLRVLIRVAMIFVVAVLIGYLAGHFAQLKFREVTGFRYEPTSSEVVEASPDALRPTNTRLDEGANLPVAILNDTLNMVSNSIYKITNSDLMQSANKASLSIIFFALNPLFRLLDWLAFWLSFLLFAFGSGWLTNRLITLKRKVHADHMNQQVIKNMEILEAKVNELVDQANKTRR